jgi:hypothetical protein
MIATVTLAALLAARPVPAPPVAPAKLIRQPGTHALFNGRLEVEVKAEDDLVWYTVRHPDGPRASWFWHELKGGPHWFVYPASADEVWVYGGGDNLVCVRFAAGEASLRGSPGRTDPDWRQFVKGVPRAVAAELPERDADRAGR